MTPLGTRDPAWSDLPKGVRRERIEPLWERVDRNRLKLALFIAAYLASIAFSAALIASVVAFVLGAMVPTFESPVEYLRRFPEIVWMSTLIALVLGSIWVAVALLRSEKVLLKRLGAVLTPTGEYLPTKFALKDMSIASGFAHAPPLWVIPDCDRVNAFAVGRSRRTSVIGVTQGFVERLDEDAQRAVFANLMARLTNGDVRLSTAVSALVGPIWRLRERDLRGRERELESLDASDVNDAAKTASADMAAGAAAYVLWYPFVVVLTEVLLAGHERNTRLTAEKADAEGMLLLKDPRSMLRALTRVLDANNTVVAAGESYSNLFYCWAGFGYAPEDDPEFQRVARLREVLGVEGLVPEVELPVDADDIFAPPPPRLNEEDPGYE